MINYTNGMRFSGDFRNGKKHGKGTTTSTVGDKEVFECEYVDDVENGWVVKSKEDGYMFIGRYLNGKTHGVSKTIDKAGAEPEYDEWDQDEHV